MHFEFARAGGVRQAPDHISGIVLTRPVQLLTGQVDTGHGLAALSARPAGTDWLLTADGYGTAETMRRRGQRDRCWQEPFMIDRLLTKDPPVADAVAWLRN